MLGLRKDRVKSWLAVDVGGANLKLADGLGWVHCEFFPLWREPHNLAGKLKQCLAAAPAFDSLAATMTGELADCFQTKREGVAAIVAALREAAQGREVWIYLTDGRFVVPPSGDRFVVPPSGGRNAFEAAIPEPLASGAPLNDWPLLAAASNWHALARYAARYMPDETGLLVDIGSTTCDMIPVKNGIPAALGRTDPERLASGELVYTGVVRSPVCALVSELPWRGGNCPTAQELFATALDAWLMLGEIPEDATNTATADGRPATREYAHDRLARSICADREMFTLSDALAAAEAVAAAQTRLVFKALGRVIERSGTPRAVVVSGEGEFLARRALANMPLRPDLISLRDCLGPKQSQAATAHALAVLASDSKLEFKKLMRRDNIDKHDGQCAG